MNWKVVALHQSDPNDKPRAVECLDVQSGKGIVGDKHFGWPHRQSLFISTESLAALDIEPGVLCEQVTIDMPGLQQMKAGERFVVGSIPFEIEQECKPCSGMAKRLGEEPENFKARAAFKRGMFATALSDGILRVGDPVCRTESG